MPFAKMAGLADHGDRAGLLVDNTLDYRRPVLHDCDPFPVPLREARAQLSIQRAFSINTAYAGIKKVVGGYVLGSDCGPRPIRADEEVTLCR